MLGGLDRIGYSRVSGSACFVEREMVGMEVGWEAAL